MTRTLDCTIERDVYIHFDCFIISYKYRDANANEKKNVAHVQSVILLTFKTLFRDELYINIVQEIDWISK